MPPQSADRPLRLLILRPTMGQGGADRMTLSLLRHFDRDLFAPELALMQAAGPFLDEVPSDVAVHDLGGGRPGGVRLWGVLRPLARLLERRAPDILFSTSGGTNVVAVLARMISSWQGRVVLSERGRLVRENSTPKRRLLTVAKRWLYSRADRVTAVSSGVRDDLVTQLGLDSGSIDVVYNPVVDGALEEARRETASHPWVGGPAPVVLAAGRLVKEKNFKLLIEAFDQVRRVMDARLLVLGEGPLRERLEEQVESLGLTEHVSLPGFESNPFAFMAACDLFVLSSDNEGLPGVLIQAMACGAAVVSTDCPSGPAEIITPGDDGFLVPVGDVEALAGKILELLGDAEARRRLGTKARESAECYRVERVMGKYQDALLG